MKVSRQTDLCLRMMINAAFSECTSDLRPSEVRQHLQIFFDTDTIDAAQSLMASGICPPARDMSFYETINDDDDDE